MKRSLINKIVITVFLYTLINNNKLHSQISTKKYVTTTVVEAKYDSLKNFLGKDVYQYIGQDLFLNNKPKKLHEYGYEGFTIGIPKVKGEKEGIYKPLNNYSSIYNEINGKYFKVLDVIQHPFSEDPNFENIYFLKLEEKESKDTIYYNYKTTNEYRFPFIVVGYYSKLKKNQIGKGFIIRGKGWINGTNGPMFDMNTGNEVSDFIAGAEWKCIDVTVEEKFFNLSLILENSKKQQIPLFVDLMNNNDLMFQITDAEKFKKKFGITLWNLILSGKVRIGMTKEMVKLSWGEPKEINETFLKNSKSEQWVYSSGNYIYFTNNILTAIQ